MRPVLFVIVAAVCFSTTGTAQAYGPDSASAAAVGLTRIVAGGGLLALVAWWAAGRSGVGTPPTRLPLWVVLLGGAAVLAYQPTFFAGVGLNGVAVGAVVTLGAAPAFTGLLEWLVIRRRPPRRWFIATGCAVIGVVLLGGLFDRADGGISLAGIAASLGAALSYAVYALAAKRLLDDGASATTAIGSIFGTAALMGAPFLLLVDLSWLGSAAGLAMVVWLAAATVAVAYVLFAIGLQSLRASTVSTLTLVEPMAASLLGVVLLDERLSTPGWIGLVVLLGGVVLLAVPGRRVERVPA
ncbi:DMT family transporter [Aeromicrobium sp.]|uniref:DMT family transporter n=1 Tax=Aeromicrobium sp. TaxID=1871063 RepID=UPI002FCB2CA1